MKILFAFLVIISLSQHSSAQPLSIEQWKHRFWTAKWISHPTAMPNGFGVYHFRKELEM
jgi:hypothetical protein